MLSGIPNEIGLLIDSYNESITVTGTTVVRVDSAIDAIKVIASLKTTRKYIDATARPVGKIDYTKTYIVFNDQKTLRTLRRQQARVLHLSTTEGLEKRKLIEKSYSLMLLLFLCDAPVSQEKFYR